MEEASEVIQSSPPLTRWCRKSPATTALKGGPPSLCLQRRIIHHLVRPSAPLSNSVCHLGVFPNIVSKSYFLVIGQSCAHQLLDLAQTLIQRFESFLVRFGPKSQFRKMKVNLVPPSFFNYHMKNCWVGEAITYFPFDGTWWHLRIELLGMSGWSLPNCRQIGPEGLVIVICNIDFGWAKRVSLSK